MTNIKTAMRQSADASILFATSLPLKQHSEPEDGAIEEEGRLDDYALSEDLDWESEDD